MLLLTLFAAAGFQAPPAPAPPQQWVLVGGNHEFGVAVERGSLRRSGSQVTAWVLSVPKEPVHNELAGVVDYSTKHTRYDCLTGATHTISEVLYRIDGSVEHIFEPQAEVGNAVPLSSTPGASVTEVVCEPGALEGSGILLTAQAVRTAYRSRS